MSAVPAAGRPAARGSGAPAGWRAPRVWVCAALMIAAQLLAFCATRPLLPFLKAHDLTLPLEARIPFLPEWVLVYCLAYLTWVGGGLLILTRNKAHAYRFTGMYVLSMALSAIVFLALPCTMERPEIVGGGFFRDWMRLIYYLDSPTNLCPSLHVMVSYLCWRGMHGCPDIPAWVRRLWFAFLILVCASILLVKQHVIVDIPAAVVVGELSMQAARLLRLERAGFRLEAWLSRRRAGRR